jgi:putative transposase
VSHYGLTEAQACVAIDLSVRTLQRWKKNSEDRRQGPIEHPRKLSPEEASQVISIACSEDFYDLAPPRLVAKLADQGTYLASESTFYRLLRKQNLLTHRSRAKMPEKRVKVETVATKPNEVWVWDITNLKSLTPSYHYKLYMIEDLFSRKIIGWDVLESETDGDAVPVLKRALLAEGISGVDLRFHADNGNPMRGTHMLWTILGLGIRPSFSRPSVSNDNPHIESLFRTMKYSPAYPTKPFASLEFAKKWVKDFVAWYNSSMHSGLSYVTPDQRHQGLDEAILAKRRKVYQSAQQKNPIRWTTKPRAWPQPVLAKLNPYGTRMVR